MTALKATVADKDYTATFEGNIATIDFLGEVTGTQATSILTATPSDGASIAYYSDAECSASTTSFTIGTAFYAKATKDAEEPAIYTINTTSQVPDATIELASGKLSQSVKQGVAISDIVFAIANADGDAIVTGLPTGLSFNAATATISGTVDENADIKDYAYTVTVNSKSGAVNPTAAINGTITVKDKNAKEIAYIYTSETAPSNDVYTALSAKYSVTMVDGTKALTGTAAETADLIVLDEAVGSGGTGAVALGNLIGATPILSFKAHMYGKTNWPAGTGNNDNGTDATVESVFTTHPIFNGITLANGNTITIADAIRSVSNPTAKAGTLKVIANSNGGASIVEENNGTATDAAKYMLIAISAASESALTTDGLKLVENAAEYLLGTDVFVPVASSEAVMTGFSIDGINAAIDEANKTVSITLPAELYTDLTALTPEITISTGATVSPASGAATDFSSPVAFTVAAEDGIASATYTVTVSTESVAITAPYSTTIPADFTIPAGFIGNATVESAYTGNDANLWYEDGETTSASVVRIGKDEKLTIVVNNPGTVNIGISATGGRTFNLYVDGAATPDATATATANKKYNLTTDVFLTGTHTIVIENAGNGGATIGSIEISDATNVEATLTSLKVAGVDATINEAAKTVEVEVPANADLSALAIVATTSAGASVTSGSTIDATSGTATITVTSSVDSNVSSTYTVTVTQEVATGVEVTEAEVVETYFISADGKTYNVAVKGLPLIKVEVLSNGTVKTSKILVED
ncbi:MAG: putative Ig domain-containing protein [Paludibacteraceae bacterium]|nr:putative Ig domain-containing protein [Paludibacteraceae bacterium]